MCLYPRLRINRKYVKNKKNGGIVPVCVDKRALYVPTGCGKCMECRKQKAREWQIRLSEEIRSNKNGVFVTLSFSDKSLYNIENGIGLDGKRISKKIEGVTGYNLDNEIASIAVRLFSERWRKKYKKYPRRWLVTELGQTKTERLHIHGLLFCSHVQKLNISDLWAYGNVWLGNYVNEKTVNYIVKYLSKTDAKHPNYVSKMFISNGLGKGYLERADSKRHEFKDGAIETYRHRNGSKVALPVYFRNKVFNDDEREFLWLRKLDKNERWINGVKVDVSVSDEDYYKLLYAARDKNRRLGYGDDSIDWEKKKYEDDRRNMLKMQRVNKAHDR